jgi:endonuclease/exonuclease/phosphatase family metal-dependent hydrolase
MKWLMAIGAALAVLMGVAPADAHFLRQSQPVQVMSQNLYIGADLARLLAGESPAAVLQTVQQTNYPERAEQIARAIDDFNPDLVGLQEVSHITLLDPAGNTLLDLDYLQILLDALDRQGEHYQVASSVDNADVTLPVELAPGVSGSGHVVDRDVIIYRTTTTSVSDPKSANYGTNFTVSLGGYPIEFTRGYTSVKATVAGRTLRFVNTHLEVENAPCAGATGLVICQDVQAVELQKALSAETLPTILVGDFNAEPGAAAYNTLDHGGYLDSWTVRYRYNDEPGFTCCQLEKLDNVESQLTQRIDHIWLSDGDFPRTQVTTTVVGDWDQRKTPSGMWYSDHGGPFAKLSRY